jgi:asparagine synthase (glutamine-hydrolysing)
MCGIAGYVDFSNSSTLDILERMGRSIAHRGPDSHGNELLLNKYAQIGLSHQRLSIIDLSDTGKQPMYFNGVWITFNGEVYNFNEIKSQLTDLGHSFVGSSDTEVVLHAYSEWGIKCVDKFIGMFSAVLYNEREHVVICLRDRSGTKPFYFYWDSHLFLFGSELKAILTHTNFKKEIDINSVAAFLQYGNIPAPYSIFKNTYKLIPGNYLIINLKEKKLELQQYWNVYDYYNKPKLDISFNEALVSTENLLSDAFKLRMIADVPVGVFLSGGYDSACLTAVLSKELSNKIKTFTIAVPDIGLNEGEYAREIANYLGTQHHEINCTSQDAIEIIEDLPFYYDEPFADSSAIPTMLVSKMARMEVKVALSADGGDEVFAGYNRYDYLMKYGKTIGGLPKVLRKGLYSTMNKIKVSKIPYLKSKYNFTNRYEKLKGIINEPSAFNIMLNLSRQFNDDALKLLIKDKFVLANSPYYSKELKQDYFTPLSFMMAIDYQTYLVDDVLQKVDRASMAYGLEAREPFLDHRLIEWAAQLPDSFKYNKGIKKFILKEITHKYIPVKLLDRPKMGFSIPIENWLRNELKENVLFYLNKQRIKEQGLFNEIATQQILDDFYLNRSKNHLKVWYLYVFQLWYQKWMN